MPFMNGRAPLRAALLGSVALSVALIAHGPAAAQSAAELQERIDMLESENQLIKQQMQEMKRQMDAMGSQAPQKPVKMVERGEDDVTFKISGQVNRAVLLGDDGSTGFVSHVDNDNSSTRMRFDAAGRVDDDLTVKSRVEVELQINPSDTVPAGGGLQTHSSALGGFRARKAYIAFDSKTFGRLALGQESVANDGVTQQDLSGTSVVINSKPRDFAGGVVLTNSANGNRTPFAIRNTFNSFDGAGQASDRQNVVRYDTPKFLGFQLSGSHGVASGGPGESVDVGLRYGGEIWDTKVAAAVGFSHLDADRSSSAVVNQNFVAGSVGLLHEPTGLNLHYSQGAVTFTDNNPATPGPSYWYVKGGWQGKIWSMGKTAVSIEYGQYVDQQGLRINGADDNFAQVYGIGLVQKIDKASTELYAGVRRYEVDIPSGAAMDLNGQPITGLEPVIAALIGARIKF